MASSKRTAQGSARFERGLHRILPPWMPDEVFVALATGRGPGEAWDVEVEFLILDGRPYAYSVRVLPNAVVEMQSTEQLPPSGVTATVLRQIRLGEVLESFRLPARTFRLQTEARPYRRRPPIKRGRPGYGDEHYRRIAALYLRANREQPRRPVKLMAKQIRYAEDTVRQWVREARRREFLTKAQPGLPGAFPGPRFGGPDIDWNALFSPETE